MSFSESKGSKHRLLGLRGSSLRTFRIAPASISGSMNFLRLSSKQSNGNEENLLTSVSISDALRLFRHRKGHLLASLDLLKPMLADENSFNMLNCNCTNFEGELEFKLTETPSFGSAFSSMISDVLSDAEPDVESVFSNGNETKTPTSKVTKQNSKTKVGKKRSKVHVKTKRVYVVLERNTIVTKTLPSRSKQRQNKGISSTRADVLALQEKMQQRRAEKNSKHASNGSSATKVSHNSEISRVSALSRLSNQSPNGQLNINNLGSNSYTDLFAAEYKQLNVFYLSRLYDIEYVAGDKKISLIFFFPDEDRQVVFGDDLVSKWRSKSKPFNDSVKDTESKANYVNIEQNNLSFLTADFTATSPTEATDWLNHLVSAVRNQAKLYSWAAEAELKDRKQFHNSSNAERQKDVIEDLLRITVDLYSISEKVGSDSKTTELISLAQEKLAEFLQEDRNDIEEAAFWRERAKDLRDKLTQDTEDSDSVGGVSI